VPSGVAVTDPLCLRLGEASLDAVALAIENFAEGDPPDVGSAEAALDEVAELLVEAQEVISRLKADTLTREEAQAMIVTEADEETAPDTRPEGT
jgi:hypothetical protein